LKKHLAQHHELYLRAMEELLKQIQDYKTEIELSMQPMKKRQKNSGLNGSAQKGW
jgi:hypothetical protein